MPSERVQKAIDELNIGVTVEQFEERMGVTLTTDELTETLTGLKMLARRERGDELRALIDQRRSRETTERTEAAARRGV